jgi:hypothetical protein
MRTGFARIRKRAVVLAGVIALGLMASACDKCGNFLGHPRAGLEACRDSGPAPR